jgi:hypothetical protein
MCTSTPVDVRQLYKPQQIQAHKQKGHGIHLWCPIINKTIHPAGILFVDDTNLEHLDLIKAESIRESHKAFQDSILSWGRLLLATGGALKPAKCFHHMIYFSCKPDGSWKYDINNKVPKLSILVPLADGSHAPINHLLVTTPTKTLGQMTCPTGSSEGAILQMKEKAQKWINEAKDGRLHRRISGFELISSSGLGFALGLAVSQHHSRR